MGRERTEKEVVGLLGRSSWWVGNYHWATLVPWGLRRQDGDPLGICIFGHYAREKESESQSRGNQKWAGSMRKILPFLISSPGPGISENVTLDHCTAHSGSQVRPTSEFKYLQCLALSLCSKSLNLKQSSLQRGTISFVFSFPRFNKSCAFLLDFWNPSVTIVAPERPC